MKNIININTPIVSKSRIDYNYELKGEWIEAFNMTAPFFIEYDFDISNIPLGLAVIPLLCNILPISWIYNAEINVDVCDEDFYNSIKEFKNGYIEMYPMMEFKGVINVKRLEKNTIKNQNGPISFFSGGVDAFNTLLNHIDEKPTLITIWGSDIKLDDIEGWQNVLNHIKYTAQNFNIDYHIIKSNFRKFLQEEILSKKVQNSGDGWWHGFQHGIGIISHSAIIAYLKEKNVVYFASSFTPEDKGKITCASDPTIDNFLRMSNVRVVHDGYEFCRQDKVHNIVKYCEKNKKKIKLRVCWQESKGENCCQCEKCWRTILEIVAEKANPSDYGMGYTETELKNFPKLYYNQRNIPPYRRRVYKQTQEKMRKNLEYEKLPKQLKWFYKTNINKLGYHPIYHFLKKIKRKISKVTKR